MNKFAKIYLNLPIISQSLAVARRGISYNKGVMKNKTKRNIFLGSIIAILILSVVSTMSLLSAPMEEPAVFPTITVDKQAFIQFILTRSQASNQLILTKREKLLTLYHQHQKGQHISLHERHWLINLADEYEIDTSNLESLATWNALLKQVDIVPNSLVIAQAINESAWGQSHFAKQGKNYFGIWCYTAGCGIVPSLRSPGSTYEVQQFPTALDSVITYMHNYNTHNLYHGFRDSRFDLRRLNEKVTGLALVHSLIFYSARHQAYVDSIRAIILHYNLSQYDHSQ